MFVVDEVIDEKYEFPQDGEDDMEHGLIEEAVLAVMCNIWGHDIVDDQCMIPEHRFCAYCNRRVGQING